MITWNASSMTNARVRAWLGEEGTGLLDLFIRKGSDWIPIGPDDVDPRDPVDLPIMPQAELANYRFRTFLANYSETDLTLYMAVSQAGAVLPADDGTGLPINGDQQPYGTVEFSPKAKHNAPSYFYFDVIFS